MNDWMEVELVCPVDHGRLRLENDLLTCEAGHEYAVVQGVPIMLLENVDQTLWVATKTLEKARQARANPHVQDEYHIDTLGMSDEERAQLQKELPDPSTTDPVVRYMVGATSGNLYKSLIGKLQSYPIPEIRLPAGTGDFLDIGCNWGRWCQAAGRKGYRVTGIDPSLGAALAARRVSSKLGIAARYVVGDARFLPFPPCRFDVVFSYSVFQHLSVRDSTAAIYEVGRVLKEGAHSMIQMPNMFGIRSFWYLLMRRFLPATGFDVRYWTPCHIQRAFAKAIGPTRLSVDGFFGLGIQRSDVDLLPWNYRLVVYSSEVLRKVSNVVRPLTYVADSLYAGSVKRKTGQ